MQYTQVMPQITQRSYFPRGLEQPAGRFRFSVDALLLASFAAPYAHGVLADLGCGCGVVGLGTMLLAAQPLATLFCDKDPAMATAAWRNAKMLGCGDSSLAVAADVQRTDTFSAECCAAVVCNPPYRRPGSGRRSPRLHRNAALFESEAGLDAFIAAAWRMLANKARLFLVYTAARLPELLAACAARKLEPKRLRCVHSTLNGPAKLVLLEARKNGRPELSVEPPLILYTEEQDGIQLAEQAVQFCPFLACNSGPRD